MKIGIPKELKRHEYRVGVTPGDVVQYVRAGHRVLIQTGAGDGADFRDEQYRQAGAELLDEPAEIYAAAEMIIKVKEPQAQEYDLFRPGQLLYCYLHLAAGPGLAEALLARRVTAVAYETIELPNGTLPCLAPMSAIAGRLASQEGAKCLEKPAGGRGVLLGGCPGVERGKVGIIGGGAVGTNAARIAVGLGAQVTILDISYKRLAELDEAFNGRLEVLFSTEENIRHILQTCDLVIAAVLIPGASAPKLIRREDLKLMKPGAVIVDVAVDQGGCAETTRPTTHDQPTYTVDGIIHYCVANMPGAVPITSTRALTGVTLPYGLELAASGMKNAIDKNPALRRGVNVHDGNITHPQVAKSLGLTYRELS